MTTDRERTNGATLSTFSVGHRERPENIHKVHVRGEPRDDCRRRFGTVEGTEVVGEVHGLTVPDGICLVCRGDASYSIEHETPVAGQVGYVSGALCGDHATLHTDAILASVEEGHDV